MTLQSQIQAEIDASGAEMGIAVHHLESDKCCYLNADQLFPMASVLKIPVLARAFRLLDDGFFRLDDRWTLLEDHKRRGSGILPYFEAGVSPTVYDLLMLMIIISDNTATDIVINRLSGPLAIEATMRELDLTDIHLKMTIQELLQSCLPGPDPELDDAAKQKAFYKHGFKRDSVAFRRSPENNASTPKAMTDLVGKIFLGEVASQVATEQMLTILSKQQFNVRLSRFLPPGTRFDHKTGTLGGVRNDSGLMYISDTSHVAVTLYVIWDDEAVWGDPVATQARIFEIETAMGKIGRLIYDYFSDIK